MTSALPASPSPEADDARPPGWHADPWRRHQMRFHDGRLWTEHVASGGVVSLDSAAVVDLPRSRPVPPVESPPSDPVGARVLDVAGRAGPGVDGGDLAAPLLLVDTAPDDEGVRRLRDPEDRAAGQVLHARPRLLTRLGRGVVSSPSTNVTRLVVRDSVGGKALTLRRPGRRTARVVDVHGPDGRLGTISVTSMREGLVAEVRDADGAEVATLHEDRDGVPGVTVLDPSGGRVARLTSVWDVPGARHHLPPEVQLLDRRPLDVDAPRPPQLDALLLAAVLSPALLVPPAPPRTDR